MPSAVAPIAFFAFNRPEHTQRTIDALSVNSQAIGSVLHFFVDGPRNDEDRILVDRVVAIGHAVSGFAEVRVHVSGTNLGLYRSITGGIDTVLSEAGRVIVVEDDILVSESFLTYMNEALDRFAGDPRVGSIHGYSPPIDDLPEYFFLRGADCWGWATWADRWQLFRSDPRELLASLHSQGLVAEFCSTHGSESLLQLARRVRGRNQSWAILWHASLFLAGRLTLHPGQTFVRNIGNDGSGIHSAISDAYNSAMRLSYSGLPPMLVRNDDERGLALSRFMDGDWGTGSMAQLRRLLLAAYARIVARLTLGTRT